MGPEALLTAWEQALDRPPPLRPRSLAGDPAGALAVGRVDAALLRLHREAFGARLDALASCSSCGEELELALDAEALERGAPDDAAPIEVSAGSFRVTARLPTGGDLSALADFGDAEGGARFLLGRCAVEATRDGQAVDAAELPEAVARTIGERLAAADPQAALTLSWSCPSCGAGSVAPLDPGALVWPEIDRWAHDTLADVADLAAAFGWTEETVLALAPRRRRAYLEHARA